MRTLCLAGGIVLACAAPGVAAAELGSEPQLMFYYQASFDAEERDDGLSFGMRLDRVASDPRTPIDFRRLVQQPALFDLRLTDQGFESLSLAGARYTSNVQPSAADEAQEGQAEEGEKKGEPGEGQQEEKKTIGEFLDNVPPGYLIGVAVGVVIFSGIGD